MFFPNGGFNVANDNRRIKPIIIEQVGDIMKIITKVLILSIILLISFNIQAYAMIEDADAFLQIGIDNQTGTIDQTALKETSSYIYNILFVIALILAIGIGMVIGVQFITGSVDEKAKIKETLVPYVVGCFIIFSAFTIWKIAIEIGNNIEASDGTGAYTSAGTNGGRG